MGIGLSFLTILPKMDPLCQTLTRPDGLLVSQLHREACFGREMKRQNINPTLPDDISGPSPVGLGCIISPPPDFKIFVPGAWIYQAQNPGKIT